MEELIPCYIVNYQSIPYMQYHASLSVAIPCYAMPRHAKPHHITPHHITSDHTTPHPTPSHPTTPHHTIQQHSTPYHTTVHPPPPHHTTVYPPHTPLHHAPTHHSKIPNPTNNKPNPPYPISIPILFHHTYFHRARHIPVWFLSLSLYNLYHFLSDLGYHMSCFCLPQIHHTYFHKYSTDSILTTLHQLHKKTYVDYINLD